MGSVRAATTGVGTWSSLSLRFILCAEYVSKGVPVKFQKVFHVGSGCQEFDDRNFSVHVIRQLEGEISVLTINIQREHNARIFDHWTITYTTSRIVLPETYILSPLSKVGETCLEGALQWEQAS